MDKDSEILVPLEKVLSYYFNYSSLRESQKDVFIKLHKGNVLAIMPTGSGKSMLYILPSVKKGMTVVVSPLISLMQDQYNKFNAMGIKVAFINSSISPQQRRKNLEQFKKGIIKVIYIAPERFAVSGFLEEFKDCDINLLAIDEAHCISEWGHDFRPDYLNLYQVRKSLRPTRTLAMTATADEVVQKDIIKRLNMSCQKSLNSFNRSNLFFENQLITDDKQQNIYIRDSIKKDNEGSTIIYCRTRKMVQSTSDYMKSNGILSIPYHAGFDSDYRRKAVYDFISDEVKVIVATTAFGMGIDKPDVRRVFHKGMPARLEEYYQQAGRAGRDGENAICTLLFKRRDFSTQENFVVEAYPNNDELKAIWTKLLEEFGKDEIFNPKDLHKFFPQFEYNTQSRINMSINCFRAGGLIDQVHNKIISDNPSPKLNEEYLNNNLDNAKRKLSQMIDYCEITKCKRSFILRYFGEEYDCKGEICCLDFSNQSDKTELFLELERFNDSLKKRYGNNSYLVFSSKTIDQLSEYQPISKEQLLKIWGMGEKTTEMFGDKINGLIKKYGDPEKHISNQTGFNIPIKKLINGSKESDFEHLRDSKTDIRIEKIKEWRLIKAKEKDWPAYVILHDSHIEEIALKDPKDEMALRSVKGIGVHKIREYGEEILSILSNIRNPEN